MQKNLKIKKNSYILKKHNRCIMLKLLISQVSSSCFLIAFSSKYSFSHLNLQNSNLKKFWLQYDEI